MIYRMVLLPLLGKLFLLAISVLVLVACAQSDKTPTTASEEVIDRPDLALLVEGSVSPDGLRAILGTGDLGVGTNRIGFVLTYEDGIVSAPTASVTSRFVPSDGSEAVVYKPPTAVFQLWPYGIQGLYTTNLTFDRAGTWSIDVSVDGQDGSQLSTNLIFPVEETTHAPSVGALAVRSNSKVLADVKSFKELTTGSLHDPDLYQTTIADAVVSGQPTVIVLASPAYCTNAVCGPQIDVLQELKNTYIGQANFIHVDFYENPQEIAGDLDRARISQTVREWNLPSNEWTFVINRQGIVSDRFEAFATFEEVETALIKVL